MSTYVMSDIHGQLTLFNKMLKLINFSDNDKLYILGDVIDRGPDGIKLLLKIMRSPNIHMLLGNHELMLLKAYQTGEPNYCALWARNGGKITAKQWFTYADSTRIKILNYINKLPVEIKLNIHNKDFILCHAQPHPLSFKKDPFDNYSIQCSYSSDKEFSVWQRGTYPTKENPYSTYGIIPDENFNNKIIIFGHTPVYAYIDFKDAPPSIFRQSNTINIDCGCAGIEYNNNEYRGRLACLRLEDMMEFYVAP